MYPKSVQIVFAIEYLKFGSRTFKNLLCIRRFIQNKWNNLVSQNLPFLEIIQSRITSSQFGLHALDYHWLSNWHRFRNTLITSRVLVDNFRTLNRLDEMMTAEWATILKYSLIINSVFLRFILKRIPLCRLSFECKTRALRPFVRLSNEFSLSTLRTKTYDRKWSQVWEREA